MGSVISNWTQQTQPVAVPPTPAQILFANVSLVKEASANILNMSVAARERAFKIFWSDPINIAAGLGTFAIDVFTKDDALCTFLVAQTQDAKIPYTPTDYDHSKWEVTFNEDGSVTITAKA